MRRKRLPKFRAPSEIRSRNMAAIKSRNNVTTERRLRSFLMREGIKGWKLQAPREIGSPDFWFPNSRVVVFVNGCFWHGCPRCGHVPKTNIPYWEAKLSRNRQRDRRVQRIARQLRFSVVRVWECELRSQPKSCISRIVRVVGAASLRSTRVSIRRLDVQIKLEQHH